jgi:hypothetical protein
MPEPKPDPTGYVFLILDSVLIRFCIFIT